MSAPKDWRAAWRSNFAPEFHALVDRLMEAETPYPTIVGAVEQATAARSAWPSLFPAEHAGLVRDLAARGATLAQVAAAVTASERERHRTAQGELRHRAALDSLRRRQERVTAALETAGVGPKTTGAEPGDFVARARERAAAKGITTSEAMCQLARENPAGHRAWVNAQKHPRLLSRPPHRQENGK